MFKKEIKIIILTSLSCSTSIVIYLIVKKHTFKVIVINSRIVFKINCFNVNASLLKI